jgi:hypothetical protein
MHRGLHKPTQRGALGLPTTRSSTLNQPRKSVQTTPATAAIKTRYRQFQSELPKLLTGLEISKKEIHTLDYVPELLKVMIAWQRRKNAGRVRQQ